MLVSYFFVVLLLITNPFVAVLFLSVMLLRAKGWTYRNRKLLYLLMLCCCVFVSMVNATKIAENDLEWYVESYQRAEHLSLGDYFLVSGPGIPCTDLGYVLYCWLLSHTFCGNVFIFKFIHPFVCYIFLGLAIINVGERFKISLGSICTALIVMFFFPYIFTMSMQLLRQFFAGCVLIYLMSRLFNFSSLKEYIYKNWFFIVLMISFHKSSIIFLPLLLLPFLDKPFRANKSLYCILFISFVFYQSIAGALLPFFVGIDSFLSEGIERASKDTTFELEGLSLLKKCLLFLILLVAFCIGHIQSKYVKTKGITHFCNVVIFIDLFIVLNMHQAELSLRFYFYLLPVLPFVYLVLNDKYRFNTTCNLSIVFLIMVFWSMFLDFGTWTYQIPYSVYLTPLYCYH